MIKKINKKLLILIGVFILMASVTIGAFFLYADFEQNRFRQAFITNSFPILSNSDIKQLICDEPPNQWLSTSTECQFDVDKEKFSISSVKMMAEQSIDPCSKDAYDYSSKFGLASISKESIITCGYIQGVNNGFERTSVIIVNYQNGYRVFISGWNY